MTVSITVASAAAIVSTMNSGTYPKPATPLGSCGTLYRDVYVIWGDEVSDFMCMLPESTCTLSAGGSKLHNNSATSIELLVSQASPEIKLLRISR